LDGRYQNCEKVGFVGLSSDGAFAEVVTVPEFICYHLPPEVSFEAGAMVEPLTVGIHGMRKGHVSGGDTVAVIGGGPIGLGTMQAARAFGASRVFVIEVASSRKRIARELGATQVIDPNDTDPAQAIAELTDGQGVDAAFECVGNPQTGPLVANLLKIGGRGVIIGVFEEPSEFNFNSLLFQEKELVGSAGRLAKQDFPTCISFLIDGRMKAEPLISDRIELDDVVEKGFKELIGKKEGHMKILVIP
jgi:(R,R)-butanediol dehydrogenase/meso-butanediol dehydrogenase/diacetyl reductase